MNEKANTIGGQAAENWCLLRLLPVIIGDKVDPRDPVWQLVIQLKELLERMCAPKITTAQIAYLNIVVEYLETRKTQAPLPPPLCIIDQQNGPAKALDNEI